MQTVGLSACMAFHSRQLWRGECVCGCTFSQEGRQLSTENYTKYNG